MAGGIAHEINNPLFVLKTKIETLEKVLIKKQDSEKEIESIIVAKKMVHKITDIIKSLSTLSRSSENDPIQSISIQDVLNETLVVCNHRFYLKGIKITQNIKQDLPKIPCRPVELGQVFINLLNNAYDAMEETIDPEVKIQAKVLEKKVIVTVANNGPSIPGEIREKIFQSFYTTKELGKGTGLGLSISQKLIEKNNGKLYLASDKDLTKFVIELPVS